MGIAPLLAGWERTRGRWTSLPTMPHNGAGVVGGVPFCPDEFGAGAYLRVRVAWGAVLSNPSSSWTFTDITSDVMQANGNFINIMTIGRPNEQPDAPPAGMELRLDNRQNLYSKNNPLCPNWPNVRSNTPIVVDATLDGGANWGVLFYGEVTAWQPGWDATGNYAIVEVSAYGRMNRLEQHSRPLNSAIYRSLASAVPAYWWPMEDGPNSTTAASAVAGVSAFPFQGGVSFDQTDSPAGGGGSANITNLLASAKGFQLPTPLIKNGVIGSSFACGFWIKVIPAAAGTWIAPVINFLTPGSSNVASWFIRVNSGSGLLLSALNSSGGEIEGAVLIDNSILNLGDGNWHFCWFSLKKDSSTQARVDGGADTQVFGSGDMVSSLDVEQVTNITIGATTFIPSPTNISQVSISNLFIIQNGTFLDYYLTGIGYAGETPAARMTRLCAEEGIEFATVGFYATDTTMGPQGVDTFMNIMRECADTDAGFLYDGLSAGLQFQGASQRYDQATAITLDVTANEITPDFKPIDDDLRTINKVTVTRKGGSSVTAEQTDGRLGTGPDGIGVIDAQISVNPVDDSRLPYRANWELHAGTIEGFRYPAVPLNLRAHPNVAQNWLNRSDGWPGAMVPGSRMDILNISSWATQHPVGTVSLVIEGWSMRLTNLMWEVTPVCTSNRKYDVFKVADSQLGRAQTDGCTVSIDAAAGSTFLVVITQSGSVHWTVDPADYPFYLEVDGIQVKVTACTGSGQTQTFTMDPTTVTKPLLTGKAVKGWHFGVVKF